MGFNISESFFGKGTTGWALEIFFKIKGFLSVAEGNRSFHTPGCVFGSMMTCSAVMRFQAGIKIFGESGVESFLVDLGLQDINVIEHSGVPGRSFILRFSQSSKRNLMACRDVASNTCQQFTARLRQGLRRGILRFSQSSKRSMEI